MGSLNLVSSDLCWDLCLIHAYSLLPIESDIKNFLESFLFRLCLFVLPCALMYCFAFSKRKRYLNEKKGVVAVKEEGCYVS